jgi:hypothetical protein
MGYLICTKHLAQKKNNIYGRNLGMAMHGLRLVISVDFFVRGGVALKPMTISFTEAIIPVVGFRNQTTLLLIYLMLL